MTLVLRPFAASDESPALAAHAAFQRAGFNFLPVDFDSTTPWQHWIERWEHARLHAAAENNGVRKAFLAADADGDLVGRASIRFALDAEHARRGGHIGYGVIDEFRRRGYATSILSEAIRIARDEGVERLLVTCATANVASARVIERCGGVFESVATHQDGSSSLRYWI